MSKVEPIPFAVWGKRLLTDGAERQLETLVQMETEARVLTDICMCQHKPDSYERHRAAVMAEIEAASYQEGKG